MGSKEAGEKLIELICDFGQANDVEPHDMLVAMPVAIAAVTLAIKIATACPPSDDATD